MKKNVFLIGCLLAILLLAGCEQQGIAATEPGTTAPEAMTTEQTVPAETTEATVMQQETEESALDHIWELTDPLEVIFALFDHVWEKSGHGADLSALSGAERVFYVTQTLEMEVNNGGFYQYFFNPDGEFAGELVAAYEALGAVKTAQICQRAIDAFGGEVPADRLARLEWMEQLERTEFDEILNDCDMAYYEYEEDLLALTYAYVMAHRDEFQ